MSKRASGEGTVFQTSNGRWAVMIELPRHPNGKRNRKLRRARTRTEAQRKLREMRAEIDEFGQLPTSGRTVDDMVADYIDQVRAPRKRSTKVAERDELFGRLIRSFFSGRSVSDVTVHDCDALLAAFIAGELTSHGTAVSRDYARRLRSYLAGAYNNELRRGFVNRNPAQVAVIPETDAESRNMRALTADEWRRLYENTTGATRVGVDLGGRHGLRPQEVRAVRWSQIDFGRSTLSVVTQFDSNDEFVDTKTTQSTRTIMLHDETLALLDEWRADQLRQTTRAGDRWVARDLVVATRWGTAINHNNHRRSIKESAVTAGIEPVTPYELRHTAISHQIEAGYSASQVADWAGTSERMIYMHYRHKLRDVVDVTPPEFRSSSHS